MSVLGKLLQNPGGSASRGAKCSKWDRVSELWGEIISLGEHELVRLTALGLWGCFVSLVNTSDPTLFLHSTVPPQLVNGLFENLHSVRLLDVDFKKTSKMADLMAEADIMMHQARHLGKYELLSFVPPLALRCHLIAAQPEKIRGGIVWPKAGGDIYRKSLVAGETLRSWSTSTLPHVAQCYSRESFLLEILPALKFILAPPLRPVAPHHLSPEEVKLLESTVGVLLGYGISYDFDVSAAQEEGLPSWALNHPSKGGGQTIRSNPLRPAVDILHEYGQASTQQTSAPNQGTHQHTAGSNVVARVVPRAVPLVVRQMITQQANQEAICRAEAVSERCC